MFVLIIVVPSECFVALHESFNPLPANVGTAVAQWLRCCATNRKVAGSILDGVIGIFH